MVSQPAGRRVQARWSRPFGWLWAKRAWVAAAIGIVFTASTLYVLWAIRDLPDPTQNVLAAGDVVVLDRNGKLIEDWNPAGHYHIDVSLQDMGMEGALQRPIPGGVFQCLQSSHVRTRDWEPH